MPKFISLLSMLFLLIFIGCANNNTPKYSERNYNQIKEILIGEIIEIRNVSIEDEGIGTVLGVVIGGVLGSTMGRGAGKTLTTLGGAVLGGVAGKQINEKAAQELVITLDSGKDIVVVSKGTTLQVGEQIRIIKNGNEVSSVKKVGN